MNPIKYILLLLVISATAYAQPSISFTFDDGVTNDMPGYTFETWNSMILDHLDKGGVKAVFFVTGQNKIDEKGRYLLRSWNDKGHRIGNHTYTHPNYCNTNTTFEIFNREFLRTDSVIKQYSRYIPLFRFPYLKEGETKEKIDLFRSSLKEHNYKNGHVTIDASDWYVDSRLRTKLRSSPVVHIEEFKKFYLNHIYERAMYYEDLAFKLTGRHIRHTLLLHHNLASALFVDDLIKLFKDKGWTITDAEYAFKDEIFQKSPSHVPAGESLIWALAKESGSFDALLRYPAEDGDYLKEEMDKLGL